MKLNLVAETKPEQIIKEYLEKNVSQVLADKINNGVLDTKDGKVVVNRKTLQGFMNYARDEAKQQAEKGANCACVADDVVFGWAIHYFEEDGIIGDLYNEDGTKFGSAAPKPKPASNNPTTSVSKKKNPEAVKKESEQISLFDLLG